MVLQVLAVCALILGEKHVAIGLLGKILVWLMVASAILSAFQYFLSFWSQVDDRVKARRNLRLLERHRKTQDAPTL
jgi:hypothetical protein